MPLWGWLVTAFLLRIFLMPIGGFQGDIELLQSWAVRLVRGGLQEFYAPDYFADHLPGDYYVLALLGHLYRLVSPEMALDTTLFTMLIKLPSAIGDIGIAWLIFRLAGRLIDASVGRVGALLHAFNPALIFLGSIWGTSDMWGVFLIFAAVVALLEDRILVSSVLGTLAFLTRPQYGILLPVIGLAYARNYLLIRDNTDKSGSITLSRVALRKSLGAVMMVAVTALLVITPFSMTLLPWQGGVSLLDHLVEAEAVYPFASVNAFNFWAGPWVGIMAADSAAGFFGVSYHVWGLILFAAAYGLALLFLVHRSDAWAVLHVCFFVSFAFFMLPTRVHERYLAPALPFAAILALISRRTRVFYVVLSLSFFANLYYAYAGHGHGPTVALLHETHFLIYGFVFLHLIILAYLVGWMLVTMRLTKIRLRIHRRP